MGRVIWVCLLSLVFLGCANSGGSSKAAVSSNGEGQESGPQLLDQEETTQSTVVSSLDGTWGNLCVQIEPGIQVRNLDSYDNGTFEWTIEFYDTSEDTRACDRGLESALFKTEKASGTFQEGSSAGSLINVDFHIDKVSIAVMGTIEVSRANSVSLCGHSAWTEGVEVDVSRQSCSFYQLGTLYDQVELSGNRLYYAVGLEPNSPETRYTDIAVKDAFFPR